MKFITALLITLSMASTFAQTISAKALVGIESRIELQRIELEEKLSQADAGDDITEGKILAAMANTVESKLAQAEEALSNIADDASLTEENVAKIERILDEAQAIINEI